MLITERTSIKVVHTTTEPTDTVSTGDETVLRCPYCTVVIPPEQFHAWPAQPRLMTGECTGCGRSVTLPSQWLVAAQPGEPLSHGGPAR